MACHAMFRVLMGELMPVTVLKGFHTNQLQMQIVVGEQERHYAVLGDKDSDPAWEVNNAAKCDVHVFEVIPDPTQQERLKWSSSLAHHVARHVCPERFLELFAQPSSMRRTEAQAQMTAPRRGGTIAKASCRAKIKVAHIGIATKTERLPMCPGCNCVLRDLDLRETPGLMVPPTGGAVCEQRHFAHGYAQCGWWIVAGDLTHSGGCIDRHSGARTARQHLGRNVIDTMLMGKGAGLSSRQIGLCS
jgi:hypothetical protein